MQASVRPEDDLDSIHLAETLAGRREARSV